ncbi:flavodoxin-dependent (E)-4-hydroxy-3-methylbut-2-enyl-diphosphate synthase [Candidatus Peregrinibacteria bacterium]|nr:flavodoxin-dependent (E)-4-hydroxy-3-methylbut-2-enyl-diphosphate synthase [Candidatus Peregrinibacteria bacterium]
MNMRLVVPVVHIGTIKIGGNHPVAIQSMTNTNTEDAKSTAKQCVVLAASGAEMVRVTVNTEKAADTIPELKKRLGDLGHGNLPIIGDFHFNGHNLLTNHPKCAQELDKYRINPGNVGYGKMGSENFATMIQVAREYEKPVRIGVNWGSLDREMVSKRMNENAKKKQPKSDREMMVEIMTESALVSAVAAEKLGLPRNKIVLSVKMSQVPDMLSAYELLVEKMIKKSRLYALHLGLTEAGSGIQGIVASVSALSILLRQGIGDTIRVSLTPEPGISRSREVEVCKDLLQAMELRHFQPIVTSCPGCGRTDSDAFQKLAKKVNDFLKLKSPEWEKKSKNIEKLRIAVMGCVVNGPGEATHADIGISLPGRGEKSAQVFAKGKLIKTLRGRDISKQFLEILERWVEKN